MKKIYFDTEFTGLHQKTTLVSIGLISDCGKTFYAEFNDYDAFQIDVWLQENVISKLLFNEHRSFLGDVFCDCMENMEVKGSTSFVRQHLSDWLHQFVDVVEMYSDCLSYDWVLFCNIFGRAFDVPSNVYYVPFDLCTSLKERGIDPDINREWFANIEDGANKHNALWDAKVIKACFEKLSTRLL